jgi:hypothetical protein
LGRAVDGMKKEPGGARLPGGMGRGGRAWPLPSGPRRPDSDGEGSRPAAAGEVEEAGRRETIGSLKRGWSVADFAPRRLVVRQITAP